MGFSTDNNNKCTSGKFLNAYTVFSTAWTSQVQNCTSRSGYSPSLRYSLKYCVNQYGFIKEAQNEKISTRVGRNAIIP